MKIEESKPIYVRQSHEEIRRLEESDEILKSLKEEVMMDEAIASAELAQKG